MLTPDAKFMSKLRKNMEAIDMVKHEMRIMKKRNRIAVAVAALTGFVMGVALMLLLPLIGGLASSIDIAIADRILCDITIDWQIAGWIVSSAVCVFTALNAYEIAMARMVAKGACRL